MATKKALGYHHEKYYYRASWIQLVRPMTFTGTICPILVGTGFAATTGSIAFDVFIGLLSATLLIQAATNLFNDYFDFRNGQDQEKWMTADEKTASYRPSYHSIPFIASTMVGISIVVGVWLAYQSSPWIILTGILGIIFGFLYSAGSRPLCSIGLGELVAAIFLGFVTTNLAYIVQGNPVNMQIITVSVPFAFLIASMILTNNIRDIEKDRAFRRTLGIILGRKWAVILLTSLLSLTYLWVFALIFFGTVSLLSAVILLASPLACKLPWSFRFGANRMEEIGAMKLAALHHWAFGLLFSFGVWMG